jgi:23S rRNA pseudouridine2604 synthase
MEKIRLSKLMSEQGICSRREADRYIELGWVFVDGEQISELGTKIYPTQKIKLNKAAQMQQTQLVTLLLNKPIGYVSGQPEPGYQPAVVLIKPESQFISQPSAKRFQPAHLRNLAPAGRLDIDSQGLLVLTQDGRIAKQLIGEDSKIEKEYLVRVSGTLSKENLALLNFGLSLDGKALKRAQVTWQNQDQLRFILHEGKKRQIRRMCELVNLKITGLKRVRIGKVKLGNLPEGQWRYLEDGEHF